MRGIFYKSHFMFVIFTAVAVLCILIATAFHVELQSYKTLDFLSDDFVKLQIYHPDHMNEQDFMDIVQEQDGGFFFAREYHIRHGYSVFYNEISLFEPDITEGRAFSAYDFAEKENVAMINEEAALNITKKNGQEYLALNGKEYRIIGRYRQESARNRVDWYISMRSENLTDSTVSGLYLFDTGRTDSLEAARKIRDDAASFDSGAWIAAAKGLSKEGRQMSSISTNFSAMVTLVILTVILVFLNSFSVCFFWLDTRRKEIAVRKMTGARNYQIVFWLLKEFFIILLASFFAGCILSEIFLQTALHLPVSESVLLMFGRHIVITGVLAGFLFLSFIGLVNIFVTMKIFNRKYIVHSLGR